MNKSKNLVAPDGGWGYAVCVAVIINYATMTTFQPSFGIIYKDFMIETQMGSTSVTLLYGITAITSSLSSYFLGALLKVVSLRKLALIASITFNAGVFMQIWIKSQLELFISQGMLVGLGVGILYPLTCTILNEYFVKKRLLAIGLTQTMTAIIAIVTPVFVNWSMELFGFKGTLMLQSAITMHTFLATLLMQPVKWHMKPEEQNSSIEEAKSLTEKPEKIQETSLEQNVSLKNKCHLIINDTDKKMKENRSFMDKLSDMLDLSLFKDVHLMVTLLSMSFAMFAETTFTLMLPQSLYELQWSEGRVAWAISLINFGDLTGRVMFIVLNKVASKFTSRSIYIGSIIFSVVSKVAMLLFTGVMVKLSSMALMGLFRSAIVTLAPLVTADAVHQSKFASAVGIFLLMSGVIFLGLGPVIGIIRDLFDSYNLTFFILNGLLSAVVIVWCTETYFYNKNNRSQKEIQS